MSVFVLCDSEGILRRTFRPQVAPTDKAQVAAINDRLQQWRKSALRKKHSYKLHVSK